MLIESLLQLVSSLLFSMVSGLEAIKLPVELLGVLVNVLEVGLWVVGADVMAYVFASVFFWWTLKATVGLAIFVWKLLPLT